MSILKPAELDFVQDLLSKAAKHVEKSEGCQPCDVQALAEYALSVLKAFSSQGITENISKNMNGAVLHAEDDQPKIAQSCLQSREQDQEQQQLQQQQQQQQQEHPELDADLLALHKQVWEKAARVKGLRVEVPALITQSVQGELEGLRPLMDSIEHMTAAASTLEGGAPPDPHTQDRLLARECGEELQAMLAATLDKLPALRARLEQTVQRLGRITAAVDAEQGRESPLKTVEKVLLERPADDTENLGDQIASNLDSSQATRRRLAKDLNAKLV